MGDPCEMLCRWIDDELQSDPSLINYIRREPWENLRKISLETWLRDSSGKGSLIHQKIQEISVPTVKNLVDKQFPAVDILPRSPLDRAQATTRYTQGDLWKLIQPDIWEDSGSWNSSVLGKCDEWRRDNPIFDEVVTENPDLQERYDGVSDENYLQVIIHNNIHRVFGFASHGNGVFKRLSACTNNQSLVEDYIDSDVDGLIFIKGINKKIVPDALLINGNRQLVMTEEVKDHVSVPAVLEDEFGFSLADVMKMKPRSVRWFETQNKVLEKYPKLKLSSVQSAGKQVYHQMVYNGLKFGSLTMYERTWIFERQQIRQGGRTIEIVFITKGVPMHPPATYTGPKLLEYYLYILYQTNVAGPKLENLPKHAELLNRIRNEPTRPVTQNGGSSTSLLTLSSSNMSLYPTPDSSRSPPRDEILFQEGSLEEVQLKWEDFTFNGCIGVGRSKVWRAFYKNQSYAVKMSDSADLFGELRHEAYIYSILKKLQGKAIPVVEFFGPMSDLIYCIGFKVLRKAPEKLSVKQKKQLIAGLDAIHSENVLHNDLKPGNFLMDDDDNMFISDFGMARKVDCTVDEMDCEVDELMSCF